MRTRLSRFAVTATAITALSSAGLAVATPADAAAPPSAVASEADSTATVSTAGWIFWATYSTVPPCLSTGALLAYPGSPIYAAYYCEENYSTITGSFFYELFLYKRF